ncbi:HERV-H LTR-associating protein 3 [Nomascus leucogenys]|uniref:HERV-H LTR-associating protein 3 n=1 Tax=Nomascus leucogenys TaxID=61853 RepID=UPI00122D8275|nr:HERV-H LTR-associating protein 3 [Nomascus leucogenys]
MHRILSQSTFTEHLLRAICTKLANMYSTSTDCKEHCRRGMTAKQLKAEAGRSSTERGPIQTPREHSWISCKKEFKANPQRKLSDVCQASEPKLSHHTRCDLHVYIQMA